MVFWFGVCRAERLTAGPLNLFFATEIDRTIMNVLELLRGKGIEPKCIGPITDRGDEYWSPCPGCGCGEDRFHVWPEQNDGKGSYWCRICGKKGDGAQFLMDFEGKTFPEACAALDIEMPVRQAVRPFYKKKKQSREKAPWVPTKYLDPAELWQEKAKKLVDQSHDFLLGDGGVAHMAWLADRGIDPETVIACKLGWNPGQDNKDMWRPRESWGLPTILKQGRKKKLWLPRGLVIPYFIDGLLHRIRIRRPDEHVTEQSKIRYYVVPSSGMAPMVLGHDRRGYVVVESELDGLLVHQEAGDIVGAIAMGSSSARPDAQAAACLANSVCILNALDFDRAGAHAWRWWRAHYPQVRRWPVPAGKDPGDSFKAGVDVRKWVIAGLPPALTVGPSALDGENKRGAPDVVNADKDGEFEEHKKPAALALPPAVKQLYDYLQQYPVRVVQTEGRRSYQKLSSSIDESVSREISSLIFMNADVADYLKQHPDSIITGRNFIIQPGSEKNGP